jgi:hypothetical protein
MLEKYETHNFREKTLILIVQANAIIKEYQGKGFNLTLRQLYYQMVARDLIPNNQKSYKRIGTVISNGRRAGLIDWHAIIDRTRNVRSLQHWDNPKQVFRAAINSYHRNRWQNQRHYIEVWIEKDALIGVISGICTELDVPYFACRGYVSDSEMWAAGKRLFDHWIRYDQTPLILHLGDHDPSGIDMTRDIAERLSMFSGLSINVERIALNMDQVDQYRPPPNPAKITDSRFEGYLRIYGRESWELDALQPEVLAELIRKDIEPCIDPDKWDAVVALENQHKNKLRGIAANTEFE